MSYFCFYANETLVSVTIEKTADVYRMRISLYRLTSLEGGTVAATAEGVVVRTVDAAGAPMTVSFYGDGDAYALRVDESTWPLLEQGTVIGGLERTTPEAYAARSAAEDFERGDIIDPADAADEPRGHYVFQPKVCSVYLEEVFGKTMCETWYNLVDAVMAGKETFDCTDQHTYD